MQQNLRQILNFKMFKYYALFNINAASPSA